jgi:hypothetical protein
MKIIIFKVFLLGLFLSFQFLLCNNILQDKIKPPFIRFLSVNIDKPFKLDMLKFGKIDSLKYNSDKRKLEFNFQTKKVMEIYFNGMVIMDNEFNYIYDSKSLNTIKHSSLRLYRPKVIKSVSTFVNNKIKNSQSHCRYMFTKDYSNLSQYPTNSLRLTLNVICYEDSSINQFIKKINKLFHAFILCKKAFSLNYLNKKLINKFEIKQTRSHYLSVKNNSLVNSLLSINNNGIIISKKQVF